jgi:MFS family permease
VDAAPSTAGPPAREGSSAQRPSPFAAFAYRDFRYYTAARFLATMAIQMQSVAVGFQVYALTGRPLDLGYVGLAQFLPIAGLSILGGQVADRFDRRAVLFVADLAFAASALALYLLSRSPAPSLAAVFAVLVFLGAARAFYGPAGSSLLPALVPREAFPNAVTWQSTLWQAAAIGGPSLGGLIYGLAGGPGPVYLGTTVALAGACVCLTAIRPLAIARDKTPATLATALAGLRYVFRHKLLLGSIALDFFAVFLGGATALLPVYAKDILHTGPQGFGYLRAAPAVGAGVMAAFLAFRPLGRRAGPKMLAGVAIFGAATVVFGLSTTYAVSLVALFALGAADMVSVVVRGTLIQQATPSAMRGRVSAVNLIFVGASNELGELESGTVAQWLGAVPSVVLGGVGTLLVVLAATSLVPEIRRVDRLEDVTPPADA